MGRRKIGTHPLSGEKRMGVGEEDIKEGTHFKVWLTAVDLSRRNSFTKAMGSNKIAKCSGRGWVFSHIFGIKIPSLLP